MKSRMKITLKRKKKKTTTNRKKMREKKIRIDIFDKKQKTKLK